MVLPRFVLSFIPKQVLRKKDWMRWKRRKVDTQMICSTNYIGAIEKLLAKNADKHWALLHAPQERV